MANKAELISDGGVIAEGEVRVEFSGPSTPLELDALTARRTSSHDWAVELFLSKVAESASKQQGDKE